MLGSRPESLRIFHRLTEEDRGEKKEGAHLVLEQVSIGWPLRHRQPCIEGRT
jgi:hypothetical protein